MRQTIRHVPQKLYMLIVGRDISIVGYDGVSDSANTQPPPTTLDQPVYNSWGRRGWNFSMASRTQNERSSSDPDS